MGVEAQRGKYLLLAPIAVVAVWWFRGAHHDPGVIVPEEPRQTGSGAMGPWEKEGFQIRPLARYEIRARILRRAHYWLDNGAKLAPVDLAVGWGPMSDQSVIDQLTLSQDFRFLHLSPIGREWPLPYKELNAHSANMHIVPANRRILGDIRLTRVGSVVRMAGFLIEADGPLGARWRSSLSRTDEGSGACELMWVGEFQRE